MKTKMLHLLLCMMFSTVLCQAAIAEDVFVTKHGKRYHKEGSRFIKGKDVTKMTKEEAEEQGYQPSSEFKVEQDDLTESK